ncbi:MAG: serine/threonine-protein kinase [Polyangiaceae bacterium]
MTDEGQESLAGIPRPGEVLVGKYRVERVLGVGGMGAVVAATHLQLEEQVAIKFLHAETAMNAESVARFLREGKAVIKIRSEHAVKVHDVGKLETGAPYLVMEHLDGDDLNTILERNGPLPMTDVVDFILQGCEAIAEAHTLGIIHRDLKPANLFLTRRADGSPCVKVLDFGISKASAKGPDVAMTKTQAVMGSPRYMSPEQMRSTRGVDGRTDIWAIGIIMYELLSGAPPFNGESMTELCAQILQDIPAPLPRVLPQIPAQLDAVVQRCLAKDPDQRFNNLAELATALAPFGTASARGSAERIVRLVQARGGGAVNPSAAAGRASLPSAPSTSSPGTSSPSLAQAQGSQPGGGSTDPTAVSASSSQAMFGSTTGGTPGSTGSKGLALALVAFGALIVIGGTVAAAMALTHGHNAGAANPPNATTAAAAIAPSPPPAPTPLPTPTQAATPTPTATATATSTATPTPAATATPTPEPATSPTPVAAAASPVTPKPPPHKHASPSPPPAAAGGMFDGRK